MDGRSNQKLDKMVNEESDQKDNEGLHDTQMVRIG